MSPATGTSTNCSWFRRRRAAGFDYLKVPPITENENGLHPFCERLIRYVAEGGRGESVGPGLLNIRVTPDQLDRAIRIASAILTAASNLGTPLSGPLTIDQRSCQTPDGAR